jgi:flagellar hook assembly protein FlgD
MAVDIKVKVFDSAGEQVAVLYQGGVSQMPGSPQLSGGAVQPGFHGVDVVFDGILENGLNQVPWLGTTDTGAFASSGTYYILVVATDNFGNVSSYSLPVTVMQPVGENAINIYNSAGELVYHESFHSLSVSATDLELESNAFAPQQGKLNGTLRSSSGASAGWSWDGRASDGHLVNPGIYTIQLINAQPGQSSMPALKQVQVLTAPETLSGAPRLLSAPGGFVLRYDPSAMAKAPRVRLYNLAGELVGAALAETASGELSLRLNGAASGVYIVIFEYESLSGMRQRVVLKGVMLN